MIEAKQPFTMLFKFDLVVPWQCVDIGRGVNKVKSIIFSKIACSIWCDSDTIVLTDSCLKELINLLHIQTINQRYAAGNCIQ